MKITTFLALFATALFSVSCANSCSSQKNVQKIDAAHSAQNSLDWAGTYRGTLPEAGGTTKEVMLTIGSDLKFVYMSKAGEDAVVKKEGVFSWRQDQKPIIALVDQDESSKFYFVGENYLYALDKDAKRIEGDNAEVYKLTKVEAKLTERYWKCVEFEGEAVAMTRDVYLIFKDTDNKVLGFTGCNRYMGEYTLDGQTLKLSRGASTMMACDNLEFEGKFTKRLETVAGYRVEDTAMWLKDAEGNEFAKFVEVLM